ncbi:YvrJ family protein [Clostridium lundense]|uniref:YvrJ family protein n=1 Tax=Clostridium lundense TaxID=319475 RepID=UPI0005557667|nr:YvrJ family protein [Clostridium lundense]
MYDELIMLISNVGFPVAVSIYLLVRLEKKLDDLTKAFSEFTKTMLAIMEHQKKWGTH